MTEIKMIATDLDGTLLGPDGQLSTRTTDAVEAAVEAGIPVVAATGRSYRSALPRLARTNAIQVAVCSNGAVVFDRPRDEVIEHRCIARADAMAVVRAVRAAYPAAGFGFEAPDGFGFDQAFLRTGPNGSHPTMDEIHYERTSQSIDAVAEITKLFIGVPGLERTALQRALAAVLPSSVTATTSGAAFVEATAAHVDKATTLALVAQHNGVDPCHVLVFGDQMNDVPMLRWAGFSVAMGNAQAEVLAEADGRAASNADDGVARVIESILAGEQLLRSVSPI